MLRVAHGLNVLVLTASVAMAQSAPSLRLRPAVPISVAPQAPAASGAVAGAPEVQGGTAATAAKKTPPSPKLQKLKKLSFDRRPSVILEAWSAPELEPIPDDPSLAEPKAAEAPPAGAAEAEAKTAPAAGTGAAPNPGNATPGESENAGTAIEPEKPAAKAETEPVNGEAETEPVNGEAAKAEVAKAAEAAKAAAAKAAREAKRKAHEAKQLARELEILQRDVTLGRWQRVGAFFAAMDDEERAPGYEHLLTALAKPPGKRVNGVPQNLQENNTFSFDDVKGLAAAAPGGLTAKQAKLLAPMVQRAFDDGQVAEGLLVMLRAESEKPEAKGAFTRRSAALLLSKLGRDADLGDFLPTRDDAVARNDRQALNLMARYHLALYAKDRKTVHLERAWDVVQAALASGEVDKKQKDEALLRAVELAPKIRDELGAEWLDESFTKRPERGMEILATIGSQASKGFVEHRADTDYRLRCLELQRTAVDALLSKAPERAESWTPTLNLLAANWLSEAIFAYQNSSATSVGPYMQRDAFGNIFYVSSHSGGRGPVKALDPAKLLEIRPSGRWQELLDANVRPRFSMVVAQLYLKLNEDAKAFPFIEDLAKTHPDQAKDLAEEFLRVWTSNHNPNVNRNRTNSYMFMYGFDQRANAIPLTRSKQERNLKELAGWVKRLRALPIDDIDEKLLVGAFTACHSNAEVYRLDAFASVFGSIDALKPKTIASMMQQMRANLAGLWRKPSVQKKAKTGRGQKDIAREVLRGYATARGVLTAAITAHPDEWELVCARAALLHDENAFRHEVAQDSKFAERRLQALAGLKQAAELYAAEVPDLSLAEETTEAYEMWFYAGLGACDLQLIDESTLPDRSQPALIRKAIESLPGEAAERHMARFANTLFTRLSSVNPAIKFRYLRAGFEIVGDNPRAYEARKVFDYYRDLVTEVQLRAEIDGSDVVGQRPFGVRVFLRHTRNAEQGSGGFAKYLQNQNNASFAYNYGRPTENYRDKFQDAATQALQEHFDVLSVTFNSDKVHSLPDPQPDWRVTPYAYLLLKARGPEVDKLPPLQLDLDFLDTSGYVVLPVASPALPLDASTAAVDRPFQDLKLTQTLDERRADQGELVLEVKANARGLVPDLDQVLKLKPEKFDIADVVDRGASVTQFTEDQLGVLAERVWMVKMKAKPDLPAYPETFTFGTARDPDTEMVLQRYADADLVKAEPVVELHRHYGEPASRWPMIAGIAALLALLAGLGVYFVRRGHHEVVVRRGLAMPDAVTPFSVLGLLREIEPRLPEGAVREELRQAVAAIERHYFGREGGDEPDLRSIAEGWLRRVGVGA